MCEIGANIGRCASLFVRGYFKLQSSLAWKGVQPLNALGLYS